MISEIDKFNDEQKLRDDSILECLSKIAEVMEYRNGLLSEIKYNTAMTYWLFVIQTVLFLIILWVTR